MEYRQQEQLLGHRTFDSVTPDFVLAEIKNQPILHQYWIKNSQELQNKLIDVFLKTPSNSDCPGYIYGFRNKKNYNSKDRRYEIKMGRTKRQNPQQRIFQWQKQDAHEYVQIFTVRSQHNMKLQALVHILFAYARKTLIINNKRRIQWFEFDDKVPTAACTNILNLLMQRVHQKDLQKVKSPDNVKFKEQYNCILKLILAGQRVNKEKRRFAIFGLPKTGKTTISHILSNHQIKVLKNDKNLELIPSNKNISKEIIQLRPISKNNKIESLKNYFLIWFTLCNSQTLIPLLIIKQSDIQSSILSGFTQGIKFINEFIQFQTSPIIVVNHNKNNFDKGHLQQILVENQSCVQNKMLTFMKKGQYVFLPEAKIGTQFPSEAMDNELKQKIVKFSEIQKNTKIKMNVLPEYNKMCHEIIEHLYPKLQKLYSQKYKKLQKSINNQLNLLNLMKFLQQKITHLKTAKTMVNRQVFVTLKHINDHLDFTYEQDIQSYLYTFCQCNVNQNLNYTMIFNKIVENINEQRLQIRNKQTKAIQQVLRQFKEGLQVILDNYQDSSIIKILNEIKAEQDINKMYNNIRLLIDFKFTENSGENKILVGVFVQLQNVLIRREQYKQFGVVLMSIFGRIKEVVFLSLNRMGKKQNKKPIQQISSKFPYEEHNKPVQVEYKKPRQIDHHKIKQEERYIQKVKPKQQISHSQNLKTTPPRNISTQIIDLTQPQFPIIRKHNNIAHLFQQTKKLKEGQAILNICNGQFVINHSTIIKNHIYILAKKIIVDKDWKMRFATSIEDIDFVIIAESWSGLNRLTPPNKSKGAVYLLKMIQGSIENLEVPNSKPTSRLRNNLLQNLRQLYLSKII